MPRYKDESPAVRVYTVSDESRYLIVRNVPALGCGDDLLQLFSSYGQVDECKPMDAEDCEPYTDVYWIKFRLFSNARFAKRKLDDSVFLGNRLQVSYAPHFETLSDTQDKLEGRRREVLARLNPRSSKGTAPIKSDAVATSSNTSFVSEHLDRNGRELEFRGGSQCGNLPIKTISSNEDYFSSHSMNQTVRFDQVVSIYNLDLHQRKQELTIGGGFKMSIKLEICSCWCSRALTWLCLKSMTLVA